MAIINRLSRLLTADFHAVLDRIEEPETLLKQALRDMQDSVQRDQQQLDQITCSLRLLKLDEARFKARLSELEQHVDSALNSNSEGLARQLIRQQLVAQQHLRDINEQQDRNHQEQQALSTSLENNLAALEHIQQKVSALEMTAAGKPDNTPSGCYGKDTRDSDPRRSFSVTDEEVEAVFLARQQQRVKP